MVRHPELGHHAARSPTRSASRSGCSPARAHARLNPGGIKRHAASCLGPDAAGRVARGTRRRYRPRRRRAGIDRRDRPGHDRAPLHVAVGLLPAGLDDRAVAARVPAPHPGRAGRAGRLRPAYAYCRALAAASPRVRMFTIGRSEEGRDIVMLAIADEHGIADLDRLKRRPPRSPIRATPTPAAADRLVATARPIYYFNAGDALRRDRLDRVDAGAGLSAGGVRAADDPAHPREHWWCSSIRSPIPTAATSRWSGFTAISRARRISATLPRQAPPYWSKYAFVDINRDAHQLTHETTKAVAAHVLRLASDGGA